MSNNPYTSSGQPYNSPDTGAGVRGAAIGLIVVSIICLVTILLSVAFNAFLLLSGAERGVQHPTLEIGEEVITGVRLLWGCIIVIYNTVILIAAIQMHGFKSYSFAKTGAILAVVPCFGPCYLLGIPFGIWGLIVLQDPDVQRAFERGSES